MMQNKEYTIKRQRFLKIALLFLLLISLSPSSFGATFTSTNVVTTTWNSSTSWTGGGIGAVPGNGDIVIIAAGTTITLDATVGTIGTLTVDGTLEFQAGTARTLTGTSVTISSTGIFRVNAAGTTTGHVLSLSGSLTNNGTLDFYANGGSAAASITFTGASNTTFSGTGSTTDIRSLTVNKGSSAASVLTLSTSNFTVRGVSTDVAGFLTLTNGTFKISGSFTMTNRVFTSAGYTIGSTTGFYLNNSNFVVAAQNSDAYWYGQVTIDAGTWNVGTASDQAVHYINSAASYTINGGALNIAGCLEPYNDLNDYTYDLTYTQTGGTVTLCTIGNTLVSGSGGYYPSFWITSGSTFNMSGGSIVLRLANTAAHYDYFCIASTRSITGGTLQIGDASSGAAKRFGISGYMPGLLITNTSGNHSAEFFTVSSPNPYIYLTTTLQNNTTLDANTNTISGTFVGDITIGTGATFDAGSGVTHYVDGNWINNGTFTYRTSTIYFNGSSAQQIQGSAATSFYNVTLDNSSGLTLAPSSGITTVMRHAITFTSGKMTLGNFDLNFETAWDGTSGLFGSYGSSNYIITNGIGVFRRYNIGTGQRTSAAFPIGISSTSYTPVSLTVAGSTTIDNFSARVSQTVYTAGTSGTAYTAYVVDRTWNVSEGTPGGSNVTLTLQWNAANELTSFSRTNCLVSHYTGGAWVNTSGLAGASGSNPYTRTSGTQTSFSPFVVTTSTTLPIELLSFDVKPEKNAVITSWSTASEINNDYYTLERSIDGILFEDIGVVKGGGNSNTVLHYNYSDKKPVIGVSYYRLKQTDYNGNHTYSKIIPVEFNSPDNVYIYYDANTREPFIFYQLQDNIPVTIEIIDASGKVIVSLVKNENQSEGIYNYPLNIDKAIVVYFVKTQFNNKISTFKVFNE